METYDFSDFWNEDYSDLLEEVNHMYETIKTEEE